jgi:predicted enzyme related to lactoylglutathione lyase
MAKLLGPDFFNLQVRDLAASRAFYTQVLGLAIDPRFDTKDAVAFDTTTIPFALSQSNVSLEEAQPLGSGVTLWIDCDDVDGVWANLEAAGATLIHPPADGPFGRNCVFADPDGYRMTANENPWGRFPLGGRQEQP